MNSSQTVSTILLALVGTGGIGAAIAAIVRLPRERNSAAVTDAQGNANTALELLKQMREERDEWRDRALHAEAELRKRTRRSS